MAQCEVLNILKLYRLSLKIRIHIVRWRLIVGSSADVLQFRIDNSIIPVRHIWRRDLIVTLFISWRPRIWYDMGVDDFRF